MATLSDAAAPPTGSTAPSASASAPAPLLAEIADVLARVLDGDGAARVDLGRPAEQAEADPLARLTGRINEIIELLAQEQAAKIRYRNEQEEGAATIELLTSTLREMSTPIIEVWKDILCLPLIGTLDRQRSAHMVEILLAEVVRRRAKMLIIDLTGIEAMDSQTLSLLLGVARAIRLLGAECVLTGVRPAIAATLAGMGADTSAVRTMATLFDVLAQHVQPIPPAGAKKAPPARPPSR